MDRQAILNPRSLGTLEVEEATTPVADEAYWSMPTEVGARGWPEEHEERLTLKPGSRRGPKLFERRARPLLHGKGGRMPVCGELGSDVCGVEVSARVLRLLGVGVNLVDKWPEELVPHALKQGLQRDGRRQRFRLVDQPGQEAWRLQAE